MGKHPPLSADFRRFLAAAASSNLGDGIRLGALPLLALSLTDDARLIALASASTLVPWVFFGPVGGALVDRLDRRRLMVGGQLVRGLLVGGLAVAVVTDVATIWSVIVVAFGLGVGEVLVDSSSQAAVPHLVSEDQLDRANGQLIAAITVFDQVVGVALGAALFSLSNDLPFFVDAATFLVGGLLLSTIRRPLQGPRSSEPTSVRSDIADGFRYLFGHRLLRGLAASVATTNFAGNIAFGVLVVLVVDELGADEAAFGVVLGVGALGGVLASLVASRLVDRWGRRRVLVALPATMVASYLINATASAAWMISVSFFIASFGIVCFNVPGQSIRQAITPEPLLGRVVASFRVFGMGAAPLGALVGGFITEAANVRVANVAAAAMQVLSWLILIAALRHLHDALSTTELAADEPTAS